MTKNVVAVSKQYYEQGGGLWGTVDVVTFPAYPPNVTGAFKNDTGTITSPLATYAAMSFSPDESWRWIFGDLGIYSFDANGAVAGDYIATLRVFNYDGTNTSDLNVTVTVT